MHIVWGKKNVCGSVGDLKKKKLNVWFVYNLIMYLFLGFFGGSEGDKRSL